MWMLNLTNRLHHVWPSKDICLASDTDFTYSYLLFITVTNRRVICEDRRQKLEVLNFPLELSTDISLTNSNFDQLEYFIYDTTEPLSSTDTSPRNLQSSFWKGRKKLIFD
jgi:hypothetical protein